MAEFLLGRSWMDSLTGIIERGGYDSYSKKFDCNSALAVIGFLIFLDILKDFIDLVTATPATARRRRKRDLNPHMIDTEFAPELIQFLYDGGLPRIKESLKHSMTTILEQDECLEKKLCRVNAELVSRHGTAGRIFGTLLSNVVNQFGSSSEDHLSDVFLRAGKLGRTKYLCSEDFLDSCSRNITEKLRLNII